MVPFVLGEEEAVLGFSLIGVRGSVPLGPEEAAHAFRKAVENPEPLLMLVTEQVARWLAAEICTAVLAGAFVQVIPSATGPEQPAEGEEALLLSALGIKL